MYRVQMQLGESSALLGSPDIPWAPCPELCLGSVWHRSLSGFVLVSVTGLGKVLGVMVLHVAVSAFRQRISPVFKEVSQNLLLPDCQQRCGHFYLFAIASLPISLQSQPCPRLAGPLSCVYSSSPGNVPRPRMQVMSECTRTALVHKQFRNPAVKGCHQDARMLCRDRLPACTGAIDMEACPFLSFAVLSRQGISIAVVSGL
jgi:hypothetical protein